MSDVDYEFGNHNEEPESSDNRTEYRLTGSAQVTLELESSDPDEGGEERTLVAHTRDLSAQGFRLSTTESLAENALLIAWVKLDGEPEPFQLTVDVIWCRPDGNGQWMVGLRILESDDTSYLDWVEAVARAMADD